jgi:PAS domain S-box-containing protein
MPDNRIKTSKSSSPVDRTAKQQSALAELSQLALQSGDISELFEDAISLITQVLQIRCCEVLEYQPAENCLLLRAGLGWKAESVGSAKIPVAREYQAGYTLLTQRRVVVDDYSADTPFVPSPLLAAHKIRSGVTVHIPGTGRPFGVLGVYSSGARSYIAEDVHFLHSVANLIATAIQRKRDEESVRRSEMYFRGLLESAPDGMAIVDHEGRIALVNRECEQLFGYERRELIGQKIEMLVPERYREHHVGHRAGFFSDPHARPMGAGMELFGRRKDGSEFPVEVSLSPMNAPEGMVVTAAIRDVSERKKAEEQIKKMNAQLEEALRRSERLAVAGRLSASLAHEISNPLSSLSDILFVLASRKDLSDDAQKMVQSAQKEVERLTAIAQETLAPHRSPGQRVQIRASEVVEASLQSFRRRLEEAKVQVERSYRSEALIDVFPSELRQVITNLISNAIDAMPQGGTLKVEVSDEHEQVKLVFSDTGTGIQPEMMEGLFEPFVTTKGEKGLGIGLWISRTLVEKVGGTIQVRSSTAKADHGTQFIIRLPMAQPSRAASKIRLIS